MRSPASAGGLPPYAPQPADDGARKPGAVAVSGDCSGDRHVDLGRDAAAG
jgi:hypothetical protein